MRPGLLLPFLLAPLMPAVQPAEILPMGDFQSVTIPIRRVGRLMLIEATIGDQTGNFVLDTGAGKLVLNSTYFRNQLEPVDGQAGGITGSIGQVFQTRIARLELPDLYYENVSAEVISLGHIENRRGVKILGLFGMSLLRNLEVVVDLNTNELQLHRMGPEGNRLNTQSDTLVPSITCPVREWGGVPFLQAGVGGRNIEFCLDTGAEANVISNTASRKVLETITITRRSGLTGTGADESEVLFGTMNDFFLGVHPLHPMQTMITSLESLRQAYGHPFSGILGYDFFEKGVVCINLVKNELSICLTKGNAK